MSPPSKLRSSATPHRMYNLRASNTNNPYRQNLNTRPSPNVQTCSLMKLPLELRNMVYNLALPEEWDGKSPELIKALRQFRMLYDEALLVFHKKEYIFVLGKGNNWSFEGMSTRTIATIKAVKIMVTEDIWLHPKIGWHSIEILSEHERHDFCLHHFVKNCTVAKDVKSVVLDCRPRTINLFYFFIRELAYYTSGFSSLTKVTTSYPLKPFHPAINFKDDNRLIHAENNNKVMQHLLPKYADTLFGVKNRLVKKMVDEVNKDGTTTLRKFVHRDMYVWDVDGEKVDKWGEKIDAKENDGETTKTLTKVVLLADYDSH
ncbi:uncharacterized protein PAC_00908 [Phialocephala subalpina]|uniref:Uncharacterized protein n=1 Tax=Phialocephala subalpina TaxID=576137 RepID=A0A1L7WE28_9HELO|nr:uncharacterized protein PAC_00908 [Phialocephala subalpina]